jgi:AraC family transcriptional regulator, regulatory protein of adaptative response / DNA-3-methyladenine glycosylase II
MSEFFGLDIRALDRARISRDPRFDGKFFIAVTSTGIYCRPICPVRSPKRDNIRYYPTAAAAAAAGYRPCLRCRPEAAPGTPAWQGTSAVVQRGLRLIEDGVLDEGSVDELAERLGIGTRHLHRLFVQHVGASPLVVAQTRRLHFAKHLLDETQLPITEIALAAGFGSVRRFNSAFHQTYGRAPREFRRQRFQNSHVENEVVLRLSFRPPYDWEQVSDFLLKRAVPGLEHVDECEYSRTVAIEDSHAIISVRPMAGEDALELRVRNATASALLQVTSSVRRMFDLAADPAKITVALGSDPLIGQLVKNRPGLRIPGAWDGFECAVRAILGQQVSVSVGSTLVRRLVMRFGRRISPPHEALTHLFPRPADLAHVNLGVVGIPKARAHALQALALATARGELTFNRSASETAEALAALPGIGKWTAEYVALRALYEPDAFPASDLVLRRAAAMNGTPLTARTLEQRANAWRPWRGYAAMHIWRSTTDAEKWPHQLSP